MDIRVLEYFLMTAREENITKAASLLHVTQPTLSRQLMQLEAELGTKLFERTNHSVILTNEGMLFRRRAQDIVSLAEKAKNEVTQNEDTLSGIISIGCNELKSVQELAKNMTVFQERYPKVKFELYSGSNEEIQERMEQGTLDMGLFLQPFGMEKYETLPMRTKERWGVLIHKDAALAQQSAVYPGDLVGTLVFTIHINTPAHAELKKWSGEFARDMDFGANYNVLHNAVIVARERKGAVICLEQDCHYDDMKFLPLDPQLSVGSALAWKKGRVISRAARAFLQFLQEQRVQDT
ncbi:MAG TPA: LysR family transcriptional regulator [Candidatus Blautia merdavium]|uniref:LysR family transcriptional regulator n=1 Tax=Candidatus Blautia merdavium TaxID=2838494 RepID=A0A9D2PR83_9FIRM|nr:LysR family transcriptional regulator [Candidatus Blautia merdavium]